MFKICVVRLSVLGTQSMVTAAGVALDSDVALRTPNVACSLRTPTSATTQNAHSFTRNSWMKSAVRVVE